MTASDNLYAKHVEQFHHLPWIHSAWWRGWGPRHNTAHWCTTPSSHAFSGRKDGSDRSALDEYLLVHNAVITCVLQAAEAVEEEDTWRGAGDAELARDEAAHRLCIGIQSGMAVMVTQEQTEPGNPSSRCFLLSQPCMRACQRLSSTALIPGTRHQGWERPQSTASRALCARCISSQ